jgi:hypothetical protein
VGLQTVPLPKILNLGTGGKFVIMDLMGAPKLILILATPMTGIGRSHSHDNQEEIFAQENDYA